MLQIEQVTVYRCVYMSEICYYTCTVWLQDSVQDQHIPALALAGRARQGSLHAHQDPAVARRALRQILLQGADRHAAEGLPGE